MFQEPILDDDDDDDDDDRLTGEACFRNPFF